MPDAAVKAQVWKDLTDPESKDSLYVKTAKMTGFYAWDQLDICEPYFDKYYEVIAQIYQETSTRYFENFFFYMLPKMIIKDAHIVKLCSIKANTSDLDSNFAKELQDGIEMLLRCKEIREFSN